MKKISAMILTAILMMSCAVCGAESAGEPVFMTPANFVARYNAMMEAMAEKYADFLGEDGVEVLMECFTIVNEDPQAPFLYYGNRDWNVEIGFVYGSAEETDEKARALTMGMTIGNDVPEIAAYLAKYALQMMICYDFQEEVTVAEVQEWFDNAADPADIFQIPGYTLNYIPMGDRVQYAVLPPAEDNPWLAGEIAE